MALDTTVAGANANAYISVAEADAFAATRLGRFAERWAVTSTSDKEAAIIQATVDVDAHVRSTVPYSVTQRLAFPRDRDYTGAAPGAPYIDRLVKEATYEQAAFLASMADRLDDAAARRAHGFYSYSDDDVSGTLALDPAFGHFAGRAVDLLRTLTGLGSASVRSVPVRSLAYIEPLGELT